eukprot:8159926-Pyramimonas_sp.AAC.1
MNNFFLSHPETFRCENLQALHGWRAGGFQNVALALPTRTIVLNIARASRVEAGPAHVRLKMLQELHGWRAIMFQNVALAVAPRTFALRDCQTATITILREVEVSPRRDRNDDFRK